MLPVYSTKPSDDDWGALHALLNGKLARAGECWEWTGFRMVHGHGQIRRAAFAPRSVLVHRYVWAMHVGEIGDWHVLHKCDNPPCVRPTHLWLGTHQDNMDDMMAKGRNSPPPMRWDGIHCMRGHVIADNPYWHPSTGNRRCKTCMNERGREYMKTYRKV